MERERAHRLARKTGESMHSRRHILGEKQEEKNNDEKRAAACAKNNFSLMQ